MTAPTTWREYLRSCAVPHQLVDDFIHRPRWARFDPELGYVLGDSSIGWGIDGSRALETFDSSGARSGLRFPGVRPRIACYGDAYTEGIQVSDGETWEEYLATHLGEPVANFGVVDYSAYQAYRRMRRVEVGTRGRSVVILYLLRQTIGLNAMRSSWLSLSREWREYALEHGAFHGTLGPSIELDLESGKLVERENPLRTPSSLHFMSDPEWLVEALHDDLAFQLITYRHGYLSGMERAPMLQLADALGVEYNPDAHDLRTESRRLLQAYTRVTTIETIDMVATLAAARGFTPLVVLDTEQGLEDDELAFTGRVIREHLDAHGIARFDMTDVHLHERSLLKITNEDYVALYRNSDTPDWVWHPNPRANHRFAYAIKDSVLALLEERPVAYQPTARRHPVTASVESGHPSIEPVLAALRDRYAEPWTPVTMARLAQRSRSSLYTEFAATLRMTPMEYLKQVRLDAAARVLLESPSTVDAVGESVGFVNRHHFTREFERRFGVSPGRYRREATSR